MDGYEQDLLAEVGMIPMPVERVLHVNGSTLQGPGFGDLGALNPRGVTASAVLNVPAQPLSPQVDVIIKPALTIGVLGVQDPVFWANPELAAEMLAGNDTAAARAQLGLFNSFQQTPVIDSFPEMNLGEPIVVPNVAI